MPQPDGLDWALERTDGHDSHVIPVLPGRKLREQVVEESLEIVWDSGYGFLETLEPLLDAHVAALDESVCEREQERTGREARHRILVRRCPAGAEGKGAAAFQIAGRRVGQDEQRRRVPCRRHAELVPARVEHHQNGGGEEILSADLERKLIQTSKDGCRPEALERIGAQRVPELPHGRRRDDPAADHVPDDDPEPSVPERDRVVPVAADLEPGAAGDVACTECVFRRFREPFRQEAALQRLGDRAMPLVQDGLLDGERCPRCDQPEQEEVVFGEVPAFEGADVEHADETLVRDQRHARERPQSVLAKEGAVDLDGRDVFDHPRLALSSDAAREALPDRHPHTLRHLHLEPGRGSRDEVVSLLVEDEERRGVRPQGFPQALEQLAQELVQRLRLERRVDHRLQRPQPPGKA